MRLSQSKTSKGADRNSDSCMENDSDDAECIYCGELWSECKDDMIQCTTCLKWAHTACADRDDDGFNCVILVIIERYQLPVYLVTF